MAADVLLRVLKHVWTLLEPLDVPTAVMGGIAVAAWKHVRATRDVDLLVGVASGDISVVLQRLAAGGVRPKRQPPILSLGQLQIAQLLYEPPGAYLDVQIDLLFAESDYHREALSRRIPLSLAGLDIEISVLACEDLILHKLLAARLIDRADAAALLRANRAALDMTYLLRWVGELSLVSELAEVWDEAFPGEQLPAPA